MITKIIKNKARKKRHVRVRSKVRGTCDCPRLSVFRSLKNIYSQIIDDNSGRTLISASSKDSGFEFRGNNKEAAREVGKLLASKALGLNIKKVVFDRGGYLFHGRVKELADGAREGGLVF
ncbi:MAG: 50S ribosomal protein L18 [Candidatus Improbicoccus devescovinae]|nr:MAG: 50S ribosomal protein L18 [Candidatus Improbicoccus devescovinae]